MTAAVSAARLFSAIEATWPPAAVIAQGGVRLRDGQGGGKRVSAATADADLSETALPAAEAAMTGMGQSPLFMVRPQQDRLDTLLAGRGYSLVDPTVALVAPLDRLTALPIPPVTTFCIWEPLAIMREIWAAGGVGPDRITVMQRAPRKTAILARCNNKPAGVGFVAVDADVAMVHAVEVVPAQRRQGVAGWIMRQAAVWARAQGAVSVAVLCTEANTPARALYSGLGFQEVTGYHYRMKPADGGDRHV